MPRGRNVADRARVVALGHRVRTLREEAGLSQEELAERADVHRTVVGFIERADREPRVSLVWRMADALGVSIAALLADLEPERPARRRA